MSKSLRPTANAAPNRRSFLHRSAGTIVAGLAASSVFSASPGDSVLGPKSAAAIEPIVRNGQAKFKFSLAAYSYRSLLEGESATLSLKDFINDCAEFDLEGTELTSYYFPDPVTKDYLHELRSHCFRLGLTVSGTAIRNDFGHPLGDERSAQIAAVKQWIDRAANLGAPVIRIFAGHLHGATEEQSHRLIVSGIEECCEYAGKKGIFLALENHGGPTATADGLLKIVRAVDSPWFGVNLDSGNFHSDDIYGELARIAPFALNVQVKIVTSGPDGKSEPMDYTRLRGILSDVGYRGFVVLEYEAKDDPRKASREHLKKLRDAFLA